MHTCIHVYVHICIHIHTHIHTGIRQDDTKTAPYCFCISSKAKN